MSAEQGAGAPSCRVADCPYVAEPASAWCAMHGALVADDSGRVDQAAGQLAGHRLDELANRATGAGCVAALALLVAIVALLVAVLR